MKISENIKTTKEMFHKILPLGKSFDLIEKEESIVEKKLKELNPLEMTPMEALNTIFELKKDLNK